MFPADACLRFRLMLDTLRSMLVELSVMEQRYQAVLAVIGDGVPIVEVASRFGVSRQTLHAWLLKYEAGGAAALADRSHAVASCPHQMSAAVEVAVLEMRREHPGWGPGALSMSWLVRVWSRCHRARGSIGR